MNQMKSLLCHAVRHVLLFYYVFFALAFLILVFVPLKNGESLLVSKAASFSVLGEIIFSGAYYTTILTCYVIYLLLVRKLLKATKPIDYALAATLVPAMPNAILSSLHSNLPDDSFFLLVFCLFIILVRRLDAGPFAALAANPELSGRESGIAVIVVCMIITVWNIVSLPNIASNLVLYVSFLLVFFVIGYVYGVLDLFLRSKSLRGAKL